MNVKCNSVRLKKINNEIEERNVMNVVDILFIGGNGTLKKKNLVTSHRLQREEERVRKCFKKQ